MTYTELQNAIRIALENPNTANRLVASLALEDFADEKDARIEKLEDFVHKLAVGRGVPSWIVDEARNAIGEEDPPDRGDAWTGGFAENH